MGCFLIVCEDLCLQSSHAAPSRYIEETQSDLMYLDDDLGAILGMFPNERKGKWHPRLKSSKRAIIDVNSIVSGRNYDILTSIIAQLLTSRPFGDLSLIWHHFKPAVLLVILEKGGWKSPVFF